MAAILAGSAEIIAATRASSAACHAAAGSAALEATRPKASRAKRSSERRRMVFIREVENTAVFKAYSRPGFDIFQRRTKKMGDAGFFEIAEARWRNCVRGAGAKTAMMWGSLFRSDSESGSRLDRGAKTAMRWGSLFLRGNVGEGGATGRAPVAGSGGFFEILRRARRGCDRRGEGLRIT
ncbi:MAG: hypothetical protein RL077_1453 [Verrucomicrobiota bacterium]